MALKRKKTVKIDHDLHHALKVRAAIEGRELRDLVEDLLKAALQTKEEIR